MGCISMTACRRLIICVASPLCSSVPAPDCHSTSCVRGVSTCFINHSSWMICWIFLLNCCLSLSLSQSHRKLVMGHSFSDGFLNGALLLLLSPQRKIIIASLLLGAFHFFAHRREVINEREKAGKREE